MHGTFVDLYSVKFWTVFGIALVCLVPLTSPALRKWAFAFVNAAFLGLYLQSASIPVFAGVVVAWGVLRTARRGHVGAALLGAGAAGLLGLFLVHKVHGLGASRVLGPVAGVLTTIGFSYAMLRLVDAARVVGDGLAPPPDLPMTLNYVLPFHMLSAGPIQSYQEFAASRSESPPAPNLVDSLRGLDRIASGLFKKYILAGFIDEMFLTDFRVGGAYFLLEVQLKYVWLYLDFSAYSDIAVGMGRLMGVPTPENFRRPFLARNLIEYWDRWHITLSQFIRRNIFIPIQLRLSRLTDGARPLLTVSVSFLVSFVLCGLWHSISLNWLAWGLLHASGLIACNVYKAILLRRLGRKGLNRYMADRRIKALGVFLTFEFAAFSVAVATYPIGRLLAWNPSSH